MTEARYRRPTGNTPAPVRDAIIKVLKDHGPMTAREIADHLPQFLEENVARNIHVIRQRYPGTFFRITRYKDPKEVGSTSKHFLCVYAATSGPDAPRPRIDKKASLKASSERYRERHAARVKVSRAKWNAKRYGSKPKTDYNPWQGLGAR